MNSIAAAYKGALDAQERDRRFTREDATSDFLSKQRDYQSQDMQAGLSSLGDRTAADIAQAKLAAAKSGAGLETLPGQTANTLSQQGLDKEGLDFQSSQQQVTQAITASNNRMGAATAANNEKMHPAALVQQQIQQAVSAEDMKTRVFGELGKRIQAGDKAGVLSYANAIAQSKGLFPGTDGMEFTDVQQTPTGYQFIDKNGGAVPELAATELNGAMGRVSAKGSEYSAVHTPDGTLASFDKKTGKFAIARQGDPNHGARGNNQHTPAQLQLVDAYMAAPENKGMTFSQAMEKVKTGLEKPRHQAILDLVGKQQLLPGADPQKEYQKWADLYDRAKGSAPGLPAPTAAAPVNGPTPFKVNPEFNNLYTPTSPNPVRAPAAAPVRAAPGLPPPAAQAAASAPGLSSPPAREATEAQYQREVTEMGEGKRMQWSPEVRALVQRRQQEENSSAAAERHRAGIEAAARAKRDLGL